MTRLWIPLVCLTTATTVCAAQLDTQTSKLSYAMGYKTGQAMKQEAVIIDPKDFAIGLEDAYFKHQSKLSENEMQTRLAEMQEGVMQNMQEKTQKISERNLRAGKAFLTNNAKNSGIVTLPSGLQYRILKKGDGNYPTLNDTVTVDYEGQLIDGKVFDSSYKRGKPITFPVNGVIQGWKEALQIMQPGATWMLYIPSNLAYGEHGATGAIGPNETLVFKVHLISVK